MGGAVGLFGRIGVACKNEGVRKDYKDKGVDLEEEERKYIKLLLRPLLWHFNSKLVYSNGNYPKICDLMR